MSDANKTLVFLRGLSVAFAKVGVAAAVPAGGVMLRAAEESQKLADKLKIDFDRAQVQATAEELQRLRVLFAGLKASVATPEEAFEISVNVVRAYPDTLRADRCRLLTNTLVNGLEGDSYDIERERYFVRAVLDLEPEHIKTLRYYAEQTIFKARGMFQAPTGTMEAGYLRQLSGWQFVAAEPLADSLDEFFVTRLGAEFLHHLWDREGDSNPYDGWPAVVALKEACSGLLSFSAARVRKILGYEIASGIAYVRVETMSGDELRWSASDLDQDIGPHREGVRY